MAARVLVRRLKTTLQHRVSQGCRGYSRGVQQGCSNWSTRGCCRGAPGMQQRDAVRGAVGAVRGAARIVDGLDMVMLH